MSKLTEFVIDLFVRKLPVEEMRRRWKDNAYEGVSKKHASGYFAMAGVR